MHNDDNHRDTFALGNYCCELELKWSGFDGELNALSLLLICVCEEIVLWMLNFILHWATHLKQS